MRRSKAAETAHPPSGQFIEVRGRRIHVHVSGEGPDLVLLHGAFGSLRDFTFDLVKRLEPRYRVIAFDRPGHGYSDHVDPAYGRATASRAETPEEQAEILVEAAATLGVTRPVVLGHSFGGNVALAWALNHEAAAVVLWAGVAMPWPGRLGWLYRWNGTSLGGALLAPLISAWVPDARFEASVTSAFSPQKAPEGYAAHIGAYMPVRLGPFRATVRQVNHLRPEVVALSARYNTLTMPIEILHGTADTAVPIDIHSRPFAKLVPSATLTELDGVGHMPHHVDPDAAIATIDRAATRAGLR